ncbi:hypothetical protein EDC94DRAFT_628706 [Helicostylum pulchrum]|nr:hypothetical protein EDC94DRAFT_628706 [Helicostylum pulchrum]
MRYYYLILILLYCIIHVNGQQETTTIYTSFDNMTRTMDENTPTSIPTATVTISTTLNSTTTDINSTSTSTTFFSPSPTSFVFTHFPIFPIHTGSSSSIMSSARPSQSAPFPDDTIGKYGRLHISKANTLTIPYYYYLCTFLYLSFYLLK